MLKFQETGRGEPILFVHAFPLDHTMWEAQAGFFGDRYRVVTPDLPGFGGSPDIGPWTISQVGEQLVELMDHLSIRQCTLVGLSLGGYISIPLALAHPERIAKLVLAHTRARADTDAERAARNDMIAAIEKEGTAILPDRLLTRLLGPQASKPIRETVTRMILRSGSDAAIHAVAAMRDREDMTARLKAIVCPALVIAGDADAIIKVEDCEKMAAMIPGGKITVIPNTGHLSNLEDPSAFNGAVDAFLG